MPVSNDELVEALLRPIDRAYRANGITPTYLAKKLKRELNANEIKILKVKGAVDPEKLPKGFKIVAVTGVLVADEDGKVYSAGETVIRYNPAALGIRQKARESADNVMGHIPARKHEVAGKNGQPIRITFVEDFGINGNGNGHTDKV